MKAENYEHGLDALPKTEDLLKNLVGSFLILGISLSTIQFIVLPEIMRELDSGLLAQKESIWISFIGSLLVVMCLIGFPLFLIAQGIIYYREARALDQKGILNKGSVVEKWVEDSGNRLIYCVRYRYLLHRNAIQVVTKDVFQRLSQGQDVSVSILEHLPHISRICLER